MEKEIKVATLVDEDGVEYELEVVKEFEYKDKKYAVLYEEDYDCDDECECEEEHSEEDDCGCDGHIYVFETVKDEDGNDTYHEVDENLMEELIPIVEKELYPAEE